MIPNNYSIFGWTRREYQRHRQVDKPFGIDCPADRLLPFQLLKSPGGLEGVFMLRDINDKQIMDITQLLLDTGLTLHKFDQYDIYVYPSSGYIPEFNELDGYYYIQYTNENNNLYSELIRFVPSVRGAIKLEWWDSEDFIFDEGRIVYSGDSFKNTIYLCGNIVKPEYVYDEEEDTRDTITFSYKQISKKVFRFSFFAPEYLIDAIRLVRLSDNIRISHNSVINYECESFLITPEWQDGTDLAAVETEFESGTIVKKLGRGYYLNK